MIRKYIIAVDPGASGGIAASWPEGAVELAPMPDTETDVVKLIQGHVVQGMIDADAAEVVVYIEKVGGFIKGSPAPGSAMFNFGRNVGVIHGALLAMKVRTIEVHPQAWQRALSVGQSATYGKQWKAHLKGVAQQLFPMQKVTLKTADALLILEHARRAEAGR
jgi:hypothetical protein